MVTAAQGERLTREAEQHRRLLVVADRIASDAKRSFREAGINYFDRRGKLRIIQPPVVIDAIVDPADEPAAPTSGPLDSQVAKEAAIAVLLRPDRPHGVRETARYIGRAPSAVSKAMAGLRRDGLMTSAGEAVTPDLFHELLSVWRRRAVPLAALPDPGALTDRMGLELGVNRPENSMGWALTDTLAAVSWGMPIVARGDHPPDFYVPYTTVLRVARSILGTPTDPDERACTVAVAPVRLACIHRVDHSNKTGERWPVANHIVVALDIAQDRSRGLEILEKWQPEGIARAWLEKTGRVNVNYTVYEVGEVEFLTFRDAVGGKFSFDLSGILDLDEGKSTSYGEVKKYSVVGSQPQEYTEYLAKCYRATLNDERPYHFFWITWHPFSQTKWARLCSAEEIRAALEAHQVKYCGSDEIDSEIVAELAQRLWLVVLSDRQETLSMSDEMLGELRRLAVTGA